MDGLGGAKSVTLSSDGKHTYGTGYNDAAVSWYERNASTGALTYGGVLKMANGISVLFRTQQITLSPDGNYAYVVALEEDNIGLPLHVGAVGMREMRAQER